MTDFNIIVGVQSGDALRELGKVQNGVKRVGTQTRKTTAVLKQHANQYNKSAVAANKFGKGALQQLGYQVGDFAVQVGNGTNALQAFGQQGSQLLGIFGPLGAILGAGVAIFAAVGVAVQKFSEGTKEAKNNIEEFRKETESANAQLQAFLQNLSGEDEYRARQRLIGVQREELEVLQKIETQNQRIADADGVFAPRVIDAANKRIKSYNRELGRINERKMLIMDEIDIIRSREQIESQLENAKKTREAASIGRFEAGLRLANQLGKANEEYGRSRMIANQMIAREELKHIANSQAAAQQYAQSRIAGAMLHAKEEEKNAQKLQQAYAQYYRSRILGEKAAQEAAMFKGGRGGDPRQFSPIFQFYSDLEELERKRHKQSLKNIPKIKKEIEKLTPHMKDMQNLANDIGQTFENAFMSVVKGTMSAKDAFRNMASDIISELYRVFVVKKITGFITDVAGLFLGSGPGSSASMIGAKASGGPVSARKPYIVGERGPELMIPSASGSIIPNNQLGGGGVTVNQTINVTTGVQQTVRTEIKSLMPQIAESAKAAVVDAKRRGGSYGRSFA